MLPRLYWLWLFTAGIAQTLHSQRWRSLHLSTRCKPPTRQAVVLCCFPFFVILFGLRFLSNLVPCCWLWDHARRFAAVGSSGRSLYIHQNNWGVITWISWRQIDKLPLIFDHLSALLGFVTLSSPRNAICTALPASTGLSTPGQGCADLQSSQRHNPAGPRLSRHRWSWTITNTTA